MDTYFTLKAEAEGQYKEKGSKFLSFAYPVKNEEEVKQILNEVKKKYFDARHHCYAYAFGKNRDFYRMNDDGEPSSTAGKPIYGQILSKNITNVLIVVVRYFGGTKLGVSGLIQAYRQAAADCLNNAQIIEKIIENDFEICFNYKEINLIMKLLKDNKIASRNYNIDTTCFLTVTVRESLQEDFLNKIKAVSNVKITPLNL
jgi:uncharacterized YigZ family protein